MNTTNHTERSHLHPDLLAVIDMPAQDRIRMMDSPRWIGYSRATEVMDFLQGLLIKPQRPRMPNLLLIGDSNNGKTTLIRHFVDVCGQGYVDENSEPVKPIILAEAPPTADEKALYISILERFWTPYRATDPVTKLRFQLIHLMRACHVRMLIIDELHSLLAGTAQKQREVMNALKNLCNELCIPIVGVGTSEAVRVLHTDPQHASRFEVARLPSWTLDKEFQRLLASFERVLPLQHASKLHTPELAMRLHAISEGNIGNLHRLLIECATEAINSGEERITLPIIENNKWVQPTRGIRELFG